MSEKIRVLLSEEEVDARIQEVADMINKDYDGKDVHMICVLKGGVFFMCELDKRQGDSICNFPALLLLCRSGNLCNSSFS